MPLVLYYLTAGILKRLDLSNNTLDGRIPSQIGQLEGASIILEGNLFSNSSEAAPLSLCTLRIVDNFDLVNDTTLCPIERNALSDFYDTAKGGEWTNSTNWIDEYASCCNWFGVDCENETKLVTKLDLRNNGLSGRLSKSIGNLTSIEVLDLSDNDIKVMLLICDECIAIDLITLLTLISSIISYQSFLLLLHSTHQGSIPTEIGLLSNLTYLRLSYNTFTGTAPKGLGDLTKLKLLQLQSNRITKMPVIPRLDESIFNESTFVTDCGVPSAFTDPMECEHCTMCCKY